MTGPMLLSRPAAPLRTLTPELTARLARRLVAQQDFRVEQLAQLSRPDGGGRWGNADPEIRASLADGARAVLGEVRAARRRLAAGTFGRCTGCGAALDVDRLELVPHTARCEDCL